MMKGLTLQQLASKIEGNKALKRDYIVPTEKTKMVVQSDRKVAIELPGHGEFPILPLAHDQIGGRAGIPAKYYDRMLVEAPELLAENINTWHAKNPVKRMGRTLGGDLRSWMSDRYQRIENEQIAHAALPVLAELQGVVFPSIEITDRRMYIHFVVPTIEGEVKVGDIVQAGGVITNSEVGCGAASVYGFIWRLICLNGMKTQDAYRRNHVGRQVEDEGEMIWADDTRRADDTTVLLKMRDMVKAVVDETRFKQQLGKMRGLTEGKITGDPSRVVEVLAARVGVTEAEESGILRSLIEGGDLSAWGLLNAVTAQAHTAKSYDRAVEFESAGGSLLELDPSEWRKVLASE